MSYNVCDICAPAIVNADLSGIHHCDLSFVEAFIESVGWVALGEDVDHAGYWACEACGETTIGMGRTLTTV